MDGLVKVQNKGEGLYHTGASNMNAQQLFQIEQRIQHNDMLLHHFPSAAFKRNTKEYAALLQANADLRTLIHEVKMSKSFRVVLTDELHRKCKMKSAATGKTVTEVCRDALTDWVEQQHPIILLPEEQQQPDKK